MIEWLSQPENAALVGALAVAVSSLLSAVLPDGHMLMKIINALALNFGKAKNDAAVQ